MRTAFLFAIVAVVMGLAAAVPSTDESLLSGAERVAFDAQMRVLRERFPRPIPNDVVLVGIDAGTEKAFPEPLALWHRYFAQASHALARARPQAVGVDIVPPERSFDNILPGSDLAMMRGMLDLKRAAPLVYVQTVNAQGEPTPVQGNLRAILLPANLGIDQQLKDPDGVSRRFSEQELSGGRTAVPTLAGQLLRHLRMPVGEGFIDYSIGAPVRYIPLHQVVTMDEAALTAAFRDRIVLLGHVTGAADRWPLPVKRMLANDEQSGFSQPGVVVHLQVLRNHLQGGLLRPLPAGIVLLLAAAMALAVAISARAATLVFLAIVVPLAILALSVVSIVTARTLWPVAILISTFWLALIVRAIFDAVEAVVDRLRLRQSFAGQVSPAVMEEMLAGGLSPEVGGQLAEVCVLFSDVRDFTTLSENMPPEVVTKVLTRYFDRMVKAVHRYHGTVDKFIGDGMMVLFGAPRPSADPCSDAVHCALAMMSELDELNAEFSREGLPTLVIGIGINFGTVTVGLIGSSERHNYSAIGDAVNVAARIEGLTKDLGRKIVITDAVVNRIGQQFNFDSLGTHKVKGHSPVSVWGIRTARTTAEPAPLEAVS